MKAKRKDMLIMTGTYDGCSTTKQGLSTIRFKFPISEIGNYVRCLTYIGKDLKLRHKVDGNKTSVGGVRLKSLRCDREGQATVCFEGVDLDLQDVGSLVEKNVVVCVYPTT